MVTVFLYWKALALAALPGWQCHSVPSPWQCPAFSTAVSMDTWVPSLRGPSPRFFPQFPAAVLHGVRPSPGVQWRICPWGFRVPPCHRFAAIPKLWVTGCACAARPLLAAPGTAALNGCAFPKPVPRGLKLKQFSLSALPSPCCIWNIRALLVSEGIALHF